MSWFGGKARQAEWIRGMFPAHKEYLELFGGGAALLFSKVPSALETYNDIDSGLVHFFRTLRNYPSRLREVLRETPYSREEYMAYLKDWRHEDEIEAARRWYVVARQSFSGRYGAGWMVSFSSGKNVARTWRNGIDEFEEVGERIRDVQIECSPWKKALNNYGTPTALVYADPPYMMSTRSDPSSGYTHEMTDVEHGELLSELCESPAMVILSSYPNEMYDLYLLSRGWVKRERKAKKSASRLKVEGHMFSTEVVWMNLATQKSKLPLLELLEKGREK